MAGWETVTRARIVRGELRHAQRRPAIAGQVTSLSGEIGGVIKCAALAAAQVHEGAAAVLSAAIKPVVSHSVRATEVLPAWVAVVVAVAAVAAVVVRSWRWRPWWWRSWRWRPWWWRSWRWRPWWWRAAALRVTH